MTEADWLTATDPRPMLEFLRGKVSDRKLRLFAVACCERICRHITDPRSEAALQFAIRHSETTPNRKPGRPRIENDARRAQFDAYSRYCTSSSILEKHRLLILSVAANAAANVLASSADWAANYSSGFSAIAVGWEWVINNRPELLPEYKPEYRAIEHQTQALLCRCIFGNPFRPVAFDPAWRTETVVTLATGIYKQRAFDRKPILADALQDAGCDNDDILTHCRGDGPHARGCWVVDLVLGKE